jgi:hypothetical protein
LSVTKITGLAYNGLKVRREVFIMAKFFTQEWGDLYKEAINSNKAYEEAAKTWEGDFYFIMEAGGPVKEPVYMYIDLYHGKCRKYHGKRRKYHGKCRLLSY